METEFRSIEELRGMDQEVEVVNEQRNDDSKS